MEAIREHLRKLEDLVGNPANGDALSLWAVVEMVTQKLAVLETASTTHHVDARDKFAELTGDFVALANDFKELQTSVCDDLLIVKRALAGSVGGTQNAASSKIKVPEPKAFSGVRSAKDLENFLWDMEQYFRAAHIPERDMVTITSMYLTGDAKLWWRTRVEDDIDAGRPQINAWETLKKELKDQFLPSNTSWMARDALKNLKQTGTVRDYVKEFSSLMLDIRNMSEDDKLFNFISGLQVWAQTELRRQNVRDLPAAMSAADGLVDFKVSAPMAKPVKSDNNKSHADSQKTKAGETSSSASSSSSVNKRESSGCFICRGPHRARECPKKEQLNALVAENCDEGRVISLGALQLVGEQDGDLVRGKSAKEEEPDLGQIESQRRDCSESASTRASTSFGGGGFVTPQTCVAKKG